jgi:hypothetical protein
MPVEKRSAPDSLISTGPRKRLKKGDYQGLLKPENDMDGSEIIRFRYQPHKSIDQPIENSTDISLDNLTNLKTANYTDLDSSAFSEKADIFKVVKLKKGPDQHTAAMFVPNNFLENTKQRSYDTVIAHLCKRLKVEIKGLKALDNDLDNIKWEPSRSYFDGMLTAISQLLTDEYKAFPHPYFPKSSKSKITDSLAGYIYVMDIAQSNLNFAKNLVANVSDTGCNQIGINLVDDWVATGVSNPSARFKPNRFTSLQYKNMKSTIEEINERVFNSLKADKFAKEKRYAIKFLLKMYLSAATTDKPEQTELFIHLFRHPNAKKVITYSKMVNLATPATWEDTEVSQKKKGGKKTKKKTVRLRKTKVFYKVSKQNFYPEIVRSQVHKECEKNVFECMKDLFIQFEPDYWYFQGGYFTKIFKVAWKIHNYYSSCLKEIANKQKIITIRVLVHLGILPRKKGVFHHNQYIIPSTVWSKVADNDFKTCGHLTKKTFAIILNPYYMYAYAFIKVEGMYKKAIADNSGDQHVMQLMLARYEQNINICLNKRSIMFGVKVSQSTLENHHDFQNDLKKSIIHNVYNEISLLLNDKDDSPLVGGFECLSID